MCVRVSEWVCVCVCVFVCVCLCVCFMFYVYVYVCVCVGVCLCVSVCMCMHVLGLQFLSVCTCKFLCLCGFLSLARMAKNRWTIIAWTLLKDSHGIENSFSKKVYKSSWSSRELPHRMMPAGWSPGMKLVSLVIVKFPHITGFLFFSVAIIEIIPQ